MEQQAERWRRINSIQGNVRSKGISSLQVPRSWPVTEDGFRENDIENPKKCNDWKKVEAPKEIEFYLRMRNLKHFGQAQGTPFTVPPLSQRFNWEANTAENELILQGDFDGDELQSKGLYRCTTILMSFHMSESMRLSNQTEGALNLIAQIPIRFQRCVRPRFFKLHILYQGFQNPYIICMIVSFPKW